jgi:enolase
MLPTGASSFAESMQIGAEVYHSLKVCIILHTLTHRPHAA